MNIMCYFWHLLLVIVVAAQDFELPQDGQQAHNTEPPENDEPPRNSAPPQNFDSAEKNEDSQQEFDPKKDGNSGQDFDDDPPKYVEPDESASEANIPSGFKINVLFVNENMNRVAEEAFRAAVRYVERTELDLNITFEMVSGDTKKPKELFETICEVHADMLDTGNQPHVLIDTTMGGNASQVVKMFAAALQLPTMTTSFGQQNDLIHWRDITDKQTQYLVQIMPPTDVIAEIINMIILYQNVTNPAIIYDDTYVMDHRKKPSSQISITRPIFSPMESDHRNQLSRLHSKNGVVNFFILGTIESVREVLTAASSVGLLDDSRFAWYAITQSTEDLECKGNGRVIFVRSMRNEKYKQRGIFMRTIHNLDMEPEITAAFYFDVMLHTFLNIKSLVAARVWPLELRQERCDDVSESNIPEVIDVDLRKYFNDTENIEEQPVFGPLIVSKNGLSQMEFSMEILAVTMSDGSDNSVSVGEWKAGARNNLDLQYPELFASFRSNVTFYRIVTVIQHPFVYKDPDAKNKFSGYCIDLIDALAERLQFNYSIYVAPQNKYGDLKVDLANEENDRGLWDGMVNELILQNADIGLGAVTVSSYRGKVVDFTYPIYEPVGFSILMALPKGKSSFFMFMNILDGKVWWSIFGAYIVNSFMLWIFDRLSLFSYQNNWEKYKHASERRKFSLRESLWSCIIALTPQGSGAAPKNLSGRLVIASWWVFAFIILASYTANMAAFLTVARMELHIESVDSLLKQNKIQYSTLNGSAAMNYFENMQAIEARFREIWLRMNENTSLTPVEKAKLSVWDQPLGDKYTRLWRVMKESGFPLNMDEAVRRIRLETSNKKPYALIEDRNDVRYQAMINCDLMMVDENFARKPYAIAVNHGSSILQKLNDGIIHFMSTKRGRQLKMKWWEHNPETVQCEKLLDPSAGITMHNIGGLFMIIFMGIILAVLILCVEYWWYRYTSKVVSLR